MTTYWILWFYAQGKALSKLQRIVFVSPQFNLSRNSTFSRGIKEHQQIKDHHQTQIYWLVMNQYGMDLQWTDLYVNLLCDETWWWNCLIRLQFQKFEYSWKEYQCEHESLMISKNFFAQSILGKLVEYSHYVYWILSYCVDNEWSDFKQNMCFYCGHKLKKQLHLHIVKVDAQKEYKK